MSKRNTTGKIDKLEAGANVARKVPRYPGQGQVEDAMRPLILPFAEKWTATIVMRLLGYWQVQQLAGGRAEVVDHGWMSRRAAYAAEADFRRIFGCEVSYFDPSVLPKFFGMVDGTVATPET